MRAKTNAFSEPAPTRSALDAMPSLWNLSAMGDSVTIQHLDDQNRVVLPEDFARRARHGVYVISDKGGIVLQRVPRPRKQKACVATPALEEKLKAAARSKVEALNPDFFDEAVPQ